MLTQAQVTSIKASIFKQIEAWQASEEQKQEMQEQIENMTPEELEEFLAKNQAIAGEKQECVYCMIIEGKIKPYKVGENPENIAALEINPLSKGHTLVIPKKHVTTQETLPQSSFALANEIVKKIQHFLNPKDVTVAPANIFGHEILNIIPQYGEKQEKRKASEEELQQLQNILTKPIPEQEKPVEVKNLPTQPLPKAPRRIP